MSMSTGTSTGWWVWVQIRVPVYDLHFIYAAVLHCSVSDKGFLRFLKTWDKALTAHCPCKLSLSINMYICLIILCNLIQWHFNLSIATYWVSWLTFATFCQFKNKKQNLHNIMKYVEKVYFFKVWSKSSYILIRSWMGDWTWMNDNNKHQHNNSDSVNFSMMIKLKEAMEFVITSHVSYIQIIAK